MQGLQFDYQTPRTYSANGTLQYSVTRTLSATGSYVYTHGADLQGGVGYQNVTQILPAGVSTGKGCPYATFAEASCVPFVDFGGGSYQATYGVSSYHGLQTKLEEQYANGLTFLLAYTFSKTMSDAGDLLNGGNTGSLRAYNVPGLGPKFDYAPSDFNIKHVVHFSGGYELPVGKGKKYMNQGGIANAVLEDGPQTGSLPFRADSHLTSPAPRGQLLEPAATMSLFPARVRSLGSRSRTRADTMGRSGSETRLRSASHASWVGSPDLLLQLQVPRLIAYL